MPRYFSRGSGLAVTREAAAYEHKPRPMPARDQRLALIRERTERIVARIKLERAAREIELLHWRSPE